MELLVTVGIIGYIFRLAHKLSGLVFLWWRKEYRFDRMIIHLGTRQGITVWGGKTHTILVSLLLAWFVSPWQSFVYVSLIFFIAFVGFGYVRKFRTWMLPPVSPKVMAILVGALFLIITFVQTIPYPILITLTISDLLMFPLTCVLVALVTVPTVVYHQWIITKAVRKLASHKKMIVIGVTGSYGKTSVKESVTTILSTRYKTLKTPGSKNSPIGIAETVLRYLTPDTQAFVVEMGAYKRGEIHFMCRMVRPEIGIITAINPQHQDLFGSIETTMKAKYELVQGLVGRKLVIANADDSKVVTMGEWAKRDGCEVMWYSKMNNARHVISDVSGTQFDCVIGKETARVETRVIGEHQVGNILAAIVAARACGMTLEAAAKAASAIQPASGVMEVKKGINGSVCIDDTFNNNPDAAKAAITFLAKQKGKKILVFQPMIELGSYAEQSHEDVGFEAGKNADAIFLTNSNWFSSFECGVRRASKTVPLMVASPAHAADYIRKHVNKGDMVLFKGKDAKHTYDELFS